MLTVIGILAISALIATIASMMKKCPIEVPVLLLCIAEALHIIPLGR